MSHKHTWLPEVAGGINLYDDPSSIADRQLTACSNYIPHGKRWKLIQGNSAFSTVTVATNVRHLMEFQQSIGIATTKHLIAIGKNGVLYNLNTSPDWTTTIPGVSLASVGEALFDHTVFQGVLLFTTDSTGGATIYETTDGVTAAPTTGAPATAIYLIEAWKNRVFVVQGIATLTVRYSADSDRSTWTGNDSGTETITSPVGDFIRGMRSTENYLAFMGRRSITVLIGDHPDNWTKRTIYEDHGTSSHRTMAKAFGGLLYANDYGVWFLGPDLQRRELSRDIRPYWQGDTANALGVARNVGRSVFMHAVYDPTPNHARYMIWVSEGSSTNEDVCWIYHFNQDAWTRMDTFMNSGNTCTASALRENASGNIEVYFAAGNPTLTTWSVYRIRDSVFSFASRTSDNNIVASLKSKIFGSEHSSEDPYVTPGEPTGLPAVKSWRGFFPKVTDTPVSGNLSFTFAAAHDVISASALTPQRTLTIPYGGTGNIMRARLGMSITGWGTQVTVSRTGTENHDFMGGVFKFDIVGEQ